MGLDMYLDKVRTNKSFKEFKEVYNYYQEDGYEEFEKLNVGEEFRGFKILLRGDENYNWKSICNEIAYWRKANQVHKWFVDNVQDGEDDCGMYQVRSDDLRKLLSICNEIAEQSEVSDDNIHLDKKICKKLLPSESGFFFGSQDYDKRYLQDILYTISQLKKILDGTDWDNEIVFYNSSW